MSYVTFELGVFYLFHLLGNFLVDPGSGRCVLPPPSRPLPVPNRSHPHSHHQLGIHVHVCRSCEAGAASDPTAQAQKWRARNAHVSSADQSTKTRVTLTKRYGNLCERNCLA